MPRINRAPVSAPRAAIENVGLGIPLANMATGALRSVEAPGWLTDNMGAIVVVLVALGMHVARDRGWLPKLSGVVKMGLVLGITLALTGCTGLAGTLEPKPFKVVDTTGQAELVVACEVKGIAWGLGDGGLCRVDDDGYVSTVEGGRASETFLGIVTEIGNAAGRVIGGLFGGIGAAFSAVGQGASSAP